MESRKGSSRVNESYGVGTFLMDSNGEVFQIVESTESEVFVYMRGDVRVPGRGIFANDQGFILAKDEFVTRIKSGQYFPIPSTSSIIRRQGTPQPLRVIHIDSQARKVILRLEGANARPAFAIVQVKDVTRELRSGAMVLLSGKDLSAV
jgi:hypothetical protein